MKKGIVSTLLFVVLGCAFFFYLQSNKETPLKEEKKKEESIPVGLFSDYMDKAEKKLEKMTLEEKVGQLFLVRFHDQILDEITNSTPSGYILFARDFENETKESISKKLKQYQDTSKLDLIFAVDEEGGIVNRVSKFSTFRDRPFASSRELYNEGGLELIKETEQEKVELLLGLGLNMNLGPVADIAMSEDDYMYSRSLGQDETITSNYIKTVVSVDNQQGIISSLKHFPGYGNNKDTHFGIAEDNRSYDNFQKKDFKPFQEGIQNNVPTILVSHNIIDCMDNTRPASLSKEVHDILTQQLKFEGVIVTDDLAMGAIESYGENNIAVLAFQAGNDLIITSSYSKHKQEILKALKEKQISEEELNTKVKKILAMKYQYKIIK